MIIYYSRYSVGWVNIERDIVVEGALGYNELPCQLGDRLISGTKREGRLARCAAASDMSLLSLTHRIHTAQLTRE